MTYSPFLERDVQKATTQEGLDFKGVDEETQLEVWSCALHPWTCSVGGVSEWHTGVVRCLCKHVALPVQRGNTDAQGGIFRDFPVGVG